MDERFLSSCLSGKHHVLGLPLKPYSLAHLLMLESIDSPIVRGDVEVTPADLVLAVRICSQDRFPFDACFRSTIQRIADNHKARKLERNEVEYQRSFADFVAYLDDHFRFPEFWEEELGPNATARSLSGPYALTRAVSVMVTFKQLSEKRVWTMGLGLLAWYDGQAAELKGGARLYNPEEEQEIEAGLQKAEAEITPAMREFAKQHAERMRQEGVTGDEHQD